MERCQPTLVSVRLKVASPKKLDTFYNESVALCIDIQMKASQTRFLIIESSVRQDS